jgi:hypothetical protein
MIMGYMRHHAIVVTGYDERVTQAHAKAVELGCCVSPVSKTVVNGYRSFCVFPDGSKEGWEDSNKGDERRNALVQHLEAMPWLDWAEVVFGPEEGEWFGVTRDHRKCRDEYDKREGDA